MKSFIVSILLLLNPSTVVNGNGSNTDNNDIISEGILSPTTTSTSSSYDAAAVSPIIIPNAINNATASIIRTEAVGDIPAKTWISFDDGPLVEVDDELSLEDIEAAYDKTAGYNQRFSKLLEPFSFESPYADPVCIFNGTMIVQATVTGPTTLTCESPPIDNMNGTAMPLYISNNGGHDVVPSPEVFVYLSSQEREALVIQPNHGPSLGGTRVVVRGITHGPIVDVDTSRALCKFGSHISHAIEVGEKGDYVVCSSPPRSANDHAPSVPVDISIMGQSNVFSGVQVVFRYDDEFSVASLHPSSGLVIGGTKVNIRGGPYQNPNEIQCRFGEKIVNATYHDVSEISCITPNLGWIDEVQRVSIFTMALNPEIQTISANVDDYINEVHVCQTFGDSEISDDELGRGFRLVAPGGSITYPLTHHTRWITHNETSDGFNEALFETGVFPNGFYVNRTGPYANEAYKWEIVLPKGESFDGKTLHVVSTGGGAVRLEGVDASVSCVLEKRGTKKLDGHFKLSFSNNNSGSIESTRSIPHNATNNEIKEALEELKGIDTVEVNSASSDINMTGSGAYEWHVTFDSLSNAGDLPLLTAEYTSSSDAILLGSNAAIDIKETRKGSSHAVYRISAQASYTSFSILFDGIESQALANRASTLEIMEAIEAIGGNSIVVQTYQDEYYFIDIMGYSLKDRLQAKFFQCDDEDSSIMPSVCPSVSIINAIEHVPSTSTQLGGHFSLHYPSDTGTCKKCLQSTTGPISAFVHATELETILQKLDLVDEVKVVITESERFEEYKLPVHSGIVGLSKNFYIHFVQTQFFSSDLDDDLVQSTAYSGDLPLLEIDPLNLKGTPTRDTAYANDYQAKVIEVVKGTNLNHGGIVEVAVSINNGHDWSSQNPLFEYKPVPIVQSISPSYGSIVGGTSIRLVGDNFSRKSARFCLFWGIGASISNGIQRGLVETAPITSYGAKNSTRSEAADIREVTCTTPASLKSQYVHVAVVANEDVSSLKVSLQARGELFRYHQEIKISSIYPASSTITGNVSIDIYGGPFFSNEGLFCKFGEAIVPGTYQSPTQVTCVTPSHASGSYALEVAQNGQDYTTTGHVIRFYHPCNVSSISPISGPSIRAGTNVKVYGENFINSTSLQCRFGEQRTPATFIHSSTIYCSSPPIPSEALEYMQFEHYYPQTMKGRLVSLEVSNNGQDFTSSGQEFLYLEDIEVSRISRTEGTSLGGTPVFISGANFGKKCCCVCLVCADLNLTHLTSNYLLS